jgi:peptidyl-prolyl cis-trans isomerase SurA
VKKVLAVAFFCFISFTSAICATGQLDGIVAVVGDSSILSSELSAYTMMRCSNAGITPDSSTLPSLKKQYIQELVDGKVLIVHAAKDTTIIITNEDVEQALNSHIQQILAQNNITLDVLEKEMKEKYGMGLAKFKSQLRAQFREQLVKQRVQQQYVSMMPVTRNDVESFYSQYKDSLPSIGESVYLSKLVVSLKPSDSLRQAAFAKITNIKKRLDNGEDFTAVAKQFSEDPNAENGGDLGFIKKGTLNELRFEEVAFSLNPGQTSQIFESRLGFHIINVIDKKDQMVHVRQIFVQVAPPQKAIDKIFAQLDSVRQNAKTSPDFIASVKSLSTDNLSKSKNGQIGWIALYTLPEQVRASIDSLKIGQITAPVRDGNEISVFRIDDRVPNRSLTLADDYDVLAEKTKEIMVQKKLLDLVRKWRRDVYVDIRL